MLSGNLQFTYLQNTDNHVQISLTPWYSDYRVRRISCRCCSAAHRNHPHTDSSVNFSGVCDPALDARMRAVEDSGDPAGWAGIDREVTDLAAWAVLFNPRYVDVTARRVEGFFYTSSITGCSTSRGLRPQ